MTAQADGVFVASLPVRVRRYVSGKDQQGSQSQPENPDLFAPPQPGMSKHTSSRRSLEKQAAVFYHQATRKQMIYLMTTRQSPKREKTSSRH
jgi:hypothetical protein